jgi:hypothetical protein
VVFYTAVNVVLFHLCDIVSTVWLIGTALSNHWTARHCHFRPLRGSVQATIADIPTMRIRRTTCFSCYVCLIEWCTCPIILPFKVIVGVNLASKGALPFNRGKQVVWGKQVVRHRQASHTDFFNMRFATKDYFHFQHNGQTMQCP